MSTKGNLSIHSENIFPIIKKWLYSDHDIFIRELISNASDAILKYKKLCAMGEIQAPQDETFAIYVRVDDKNNTITVSDNGIGMTAEEIEKYINQIAFSGAEDFLNKYKDKMDQDQIIGHFGLGFYSSFMVADKVEILTKSYQDAPAMLWSCDGGTTYEMTESERAERGSDIILHVSEESKSFASFYKLSEIIRKYCSFMPVPIYVIDVNKEVKEGEEAPELVAINETTPLYVKKPSECTDEDYKAFYQSTFMDFNEPLFWIHLNMDYPFNLKGILYFPKLQNEFEMTEGKIKLYNNQVFVAENIKEVIPEFLLLLKGIIDCPDLPLNVSRSFLQNDGFVKKISDYITKKVADKLISLSKKERETYEKCWEDIAPFIKYGCLKESKFAEKMKDHILFKTLDDTYMTLENYLEPLKDADEKVVYYVSDKIQQSQYIQLFKENGVQAIYLAHPIDAPFITQLEQLHNGTSFKRIDSDLSGALKQDETDKSHEENLTKLFQDVLGQPDLKINVENLKSNQVASMLLVSEQGRRMQEMMKMYGMSLGQLPPAETTLVLNQNHPLMEKLLQDDLNQETRTLLCEHLYDLARLANQTLEPDVMTKFIDRNNTLLMHFVSA
jgi:molecular chaperone HtpG